MVSPETVAAQPLIAICNALDQYNNTLSADD